MQHLQERRREPDGFLPLFEYNPHACFTIGNVHKMIDKNLLTRTVEDAIKDTGLFLVEIKVTPDNEITVTVDSNEGVDIEQCLAVTRRVEEVFDRDVEDYELEVGSAGLTAPFKVKAQYDKNVGNPVEVLTRDGRKIHGTLKAVADDFSNCTVSYTKKEKVEGQKRPVAVETDEILPIDNIKSIVYEIKF